MIFKLHYWFIASGANALGILLGVFFATYTDATATEIGFVYMLMPFSAMIFKPILCSLADRKQAHQRMLITLLLMAAVGYLPFVLVPMMGPQLYEAYPRSCWYFFLSFKIAGDIAFGGACSIGDSLAINYAHRVGTDFAVYRVWGTISWMFFGAIVGQINEVWFLPKYVPAFMVLISASLMNAFIIWLWPAEYFRMVPMNETLKVERRRPSLDSATMKEQNADEAPKSRVLMPRAVVWAHAKGRLLALLTCSYSTGLQPEEDKRQQQACQVIGGNKESGAQLAKLAETDTPHEIDRGTQLKILALLLRRDPRILLYLLVFIFAGASVIPLSFFYMSLSELCHETQQCDFSQLGGLLQVSMAFAETILFIYIKRIIATIGRLNTISIAFALVCLKYSFYGTIWPSVNPYFSLLSEVPNGIIFGVYLTLMVELAHFFSNEVEFIIPELVERGVVRSDDQASCERLKMSLSATMQALMSSANDGIGRGFGALIYGIILDHYPYQTLWRIIATGAVCVLVLIQATNALDHCLGLKLGLDQRFKREMELQANIKENGAKATNPMGDGLDAISIKSRGKPSGADMRMQQVT